MKFVSSNHAFGGSALHLQFTPKKRRKVFMNKLVQEACRARFQEKAQQLHMNFEAREFGPDHVHIFVKPPVALATGVSFLFQPISICGLKAAALEKKVTHWKNFSIPQLAQHFKGASSRQLREDFGEFLAHYNMGDSFWSDGYFYETCGSVTAEARKYYIERMQGKHWVGLNQSHARAL